MANSDGIDWAELLGPYQDQSISSGKDARAVLAAALGSDAITAGVDYYLDNWMDSGTEVLRHIFKLLKPALATEGLFSVLEDAGEEPYRRRAAADLLTVTCEETDLPKIEAFIGRDSICESTVAQVLNQLRWSIDCNTAATARIIERCLLEGTPNALIAALQVAPIAHEGMTNPDRSEVDRAGPLSVDDVAELFTVSLKHPEQSVQDTALTSLPDQLIPRVKEHIETISDDGGELSDLATEVLERQDANRGSLEHGK